MIKATPAAILPTGASDILLALEHLPSENTLAYALGGDRQLILNQGRWRLITQDDLPIVTSPHVLRLGRLYTLVRNRETDTMAEALTEGVRELLVQQDVRTRYVHELDNEELLELTNLSVRLNMKVDTASKHLKYVFAPELVRRGLQDEALRAAQKLFWRIAAEWVWSSGHRPQERLDSNSMDKDEPYKGFLRALQTTRKAANCDNRTLLAGISPDKVTDLIDLAVWGDWYDFDLNLLRDAIEMVKTSSDQTPPKNGPSILHEDHQCVLELLECRGWFQRLRLKRCRAYTREHLARFIRMADKLARQVSSPSVVTSARRLRTWWDRDPDLLVAILQVR